MRVYSTARSYYARLDYYGRLRTTSAKVLHQDVFNAKRPSTPSPVRQRCRQPYYCPFPALRHMITALRDASAEMIQPGSLLSMVDEIFFLDRASGQHSGAITSSRQLAPSLPHIDNGRAWLVQEIIRIPSTKLSTPTSACFTALQATARPSAYPAQPRRKKQLTFLKYVHKTYGTMPWNLATL